MMAHEIKLLLHVGLCAAIFWSCFCRQARATAHSTRPQVRAAFALLGAASIALGIAPWAPALWPECPDYAPSWPELLMLAAISVVQGVTAHYWRAGVPRDFQRKEGNSR